MLGATCYSRIGLHLRYEGLGVEPGSEERERRDAMSWNRYLTIIALAILLAMLRLILS